MSKHLKHCQLGLFFVVNNTAAVENQDVPDLFFQIEDLVAETLFKASKQEAFWKKQVVDHDTTYMNEPYEICQTGYEVETINGKVGQSIWVHSEAEIPKADEELIVSLAKRCMAEVATAKDVSIDFLGTKNYKVYEVSEMSDLLPA